MLVSAAALWEYSVMHAEIVTVKVISGNRSVDIDLELFYLHYY